MSERVCWAELTPASFRLRRDAMPIAYLPVGLCEPHGPNTALGLDLIKAERLCMATASRYGGIVAPSLGFHIHECGPSARWLVDNVGEVEPHLSSVGPTAFFHFLLHQLRAIANARFIAALVVSGHAGAHADDLSELTKRFGARFDFPCRYVTDFELARPEYEPDHAGKYELSLLWHLRPDLMDRPAAESNDTVAAEGRMALGADAALADPKWGAVVFEHLITRLGEHSRELIQQGSNQPRRIQFSEADELWQEWSARLREWKCAKPRADQLSVPDSSRWKTEENLFDSL